MADEREDLPTFDEFGDIVQDITANQDGLTYSSPKPTIPRDQRPIIDIPKVQEKGDVASFLFGPDVQTYGSGFQAAGRTLERLVKAGMGIEQPERRNEFSMFESFAAGLIDASIKIPYAYASLGAEIIDAAKGNGIPVDERAITKLEQYFKNSVVGRIGTEAESIARDDMVGKLTSAFGQLYGGGKAGIAIANKMMKTSNKIVDKVFTAKKADKLIQPNLNAIQAGRKATQLNKLSGKQKFIGIAVGGGAGAGLVADVEDIGSWGDVLKDWGWEGAPSALDRVERADSQDEALRRLRNRFKLGTESAVLSVPIAYGLGKVAQKIANEGEKLAYSDKKIDQWIDKFAGLLRSRAQKSQTLFEGVQKVEGQVSAGQITAKDMILDLNKSINNVAKQSKLKLGGEEAKRLIGRLDELLVATDDVVEDGVIKFKGFDPKTLNQFKGFADEIGLDKTQVNNLVSEMVKTREQFNYLKNTILRGKNINVGTQEFNKIMSDRLRNMFNSEYKIFEGSPIIPFLRYKPTADQITEVQKILDRYARQNGVKYTADDLDILVTDIIKNVRLNPLTKTPEFFLTKSSVLDDVQTQLINISDNIKGGKFQPTDLIKTKADLRAFQRFFGQKRDIRNTIVNTMQDLSTLAARDGFYNGVLQESKELIKQGKRAVVYPTRIEALRAFPNQNVTKNPNGLQIKSPLGDDIYTNPLNGKFTSEPFENALKFSERNAFTELGKGIIWQHLVLIPKGGIQIAKTILSPFTHTRNFFTSAQFAAGTGNLFKNPATMVRNFKQAFNTIQPQLLYRNTPRDQQLYKFLLEEQVVSSSANYKDLSNLLDDIQKSSSGDFYINVFNKLNKAMGPLGKPVAAVGRGLKKIYTTAADLYVAEDDTWKVFNFLGEFDTYKNAYADALKNGLIKKMPNDLSIMKEAANIVRNTVPNYSYVSDLVKINRRLPLGNFVSFPAEVIRTGTNIIELGVRESRNPIFSAIGKKRLASFGTTTAIAIPAMAAILKGMYGITNDMISAAREFTPDFMKDDALLIYAGEDGKLRMVNASGGFVYDSFTQPVTTVLAELESNETFDPKQPLSVGVANGLIKSMGKLMDPFVSESIWYQVVNDLIIRGGRTKEGYRLWNPEAPLGEKISKAVAYLVKQTAPGSYPQFERLGRAVFDVPGERGEKFDVSDEVAGFYGFRGIQINPKKQIGPKINKFQTGLRDTRTLLTAETTKGGVISENDIIERFYVANKQRYKKFNEMQRTVKAAKFLKMKDEDLFIEFKKRNLAKNLNFINNDEFNPLSIGRGTARSYREQFEQLQEDFDNIQLTAPYSDRTIDRINRMREKMIGMPLNRNFDDYIDINKYLIKDNRRGDVPEASGERQVTQVPPLPEQPMPNPQIITPPMPQMSQLNQGLTPAESALLSEEDKQLRLRQRGLG
jgi:hypothetical protein